MSCIDFVISNEFSTYKMLCATGRWFGGVINNFSSFLKYLMFAKFDLLSTCVLYLLSRVFWLLLLTCIIIMVLKFLNLKSGSYFICTFYRLLVHAVCIVVPCDGASLYHIMVHLCTIWWCTVVPCDGASLYHVCLYVVFCTFV